MTTRTTTRIATADGQGRYEAHAGFEIIARDRSLSAVMNAADARASARGDIVFVDAMLGDGQSERIYDTSGYGTDRAAMARHLASDIG